MMEAAKDSVKKVANVTLISPLEPFVRSFANERVTEWSQNTLDTLPRRLPDMMQKNEEVDPEKDGFFEQNRDAALKKIASRMEKNSDGLIAWVKKDFGDGLKTHAEGVTNRVTEATMMAMREQVGVVPKDHEQATEKEIRDLPEPDGPVTEAQEKAFYDTPKDEHVKVVENKVNKYLQPRLKDIEKELHQIYQTIFEQAVFKYFSRDGQFGMDPEDIEQNGEGKKELGFGEMFKNAISDSVQSHPEAMKKIIAGAQRVLDQPMRAVVQDQVKELEKSMVQGSGEKVRTFLDKLPGM